MKNNIVDLNMQGVPKAVAERISQDIDKWAVAEYGGGHRSHLGGSLIGDECSRKLQFIFRWINEQKFTGRQLRLFQRGHREEHIFTEYLKGIGAKVYDFYDEELAKRLRFDTLEHIAESEIDSDNKGARQFRITGVNGHFGGSIDGIVFLPEVYGISEPLLLEYKTNSTGQAFTSLLNKGVAMSKPVHFAQVNAYGYAYKLNYALYMNVNKNDDSIHVEIVRLNHDFGKNQFEKAERIIMSEEPLPKISQSPAQIPCSWCNFKEVCFNSKLPEKNCRSCKNAIPIQNGQWGCLKWNAIIPNKDAIITACDQWRPFVNGE